MIPTSTLAVKPKIFPNTADALVGAVPAAAIGFAGADVGPADAVDGADGDAAGSVAAELAGDGFAGAPELTAAVEVSSGFTGSGAGVAGTTGDAGGITSGV